MAIKYDDNEKIFNLQTKNTSYILGVLKEKYLLHLYYGKKINTYKNIEDNLPVVETRCWEGEDIEGFGYSSANLPLEYPCYGSPDYRTPAFHAEYRNPKTGKTYRGDYLLNVGLYFNDYKDLHSEVLVFEKV